MISIQVIKLAMGVLSQRIEDGSEKVVSQQVVFWQVVFYNGATMKNI